MKDEVQITRVFSKVEETLIAHGDLRKNARTEGRKEHLRLLQKFLTCKDDVFYFKLVTVAFYSGFRASVVQQKMPAIRRYFSNYRKVALYSRADVRRILTDENMIKNETKVRALIDNAKAFQEIIGEHHSFRNFMLSFNPNFPLSGDRLNDLRAALRRKFRYLGPATVNHFLTDFAFPVLKPDRMVMRVLHRTHLTRGESEAYYGQAISIGNLIAARYELPMRYVDSVLVMLGQAEEANICRKTKPLCNICFLKSTCNFKN